MRKIGLLLAVLVLPAIVFSAYERCDFVSQGVTHCSGGSYEVRASCGITCGEMKGGNYVLIGEGPFEPITGIEEDPLAHQPTVFSLSQNYPNPFYSYTTIKYAIPKQTDVEIKVYSITGQVIRTIEIRGQKPGFYKVEWSGRDERGQRVAPGVYFYHLSAGEFRDTKKIVLLR